MKNPDAFESLEACLDGLRRCPYRRKHRHTVYCHGCKYEHYTHCHIVLYTDKVIYQTMAEEHNKEQER